jgi:hypothetical protein
MIVRMVKGRSVLADYANHRIYRVTDIDWRKSPRSKVDDTDMSFIEYYKKNYAIKIYDDS